MEENETVARYFVTIKVGDDYHKEGETYRIAEYELEDVKEHGIRLEVSKDRWKTHYHYYPVHISKKVYRLDLISSETVEGGDRENIVAGAKLLAITAMTTKLTIGRIIGHRRNPTVFLCNGIIIPFP